MEKFGDLVKKTVINFKLDLCCFVASVRTGALTLATINVILGLIVLELLAEKDEEGHDPLLLLALKALSDIEEKPPNFVPACVIAYAAEIASNALVLCAMWRNDLVLLRAYLYYALGVLTAAVMVYSVVFGALEIVPELLIVASLGTQLYQIMLVRSAMVEIKQGSVNNGYTVNLRPNDESGAGPNEKFTVTIEPEKFKRPIVIPLSKEDISNPVVIKEASSKPVSTKEVFKPVLTKEVSKPVLTKEVSKPVLTKEVSKPVLTKEVSKGWAMDAGVTVHSPAKEAYLREAKPMKEDIVKPSRVFVKEKVKIGDTNVKIQKVEETKKV